MIQARDSYLRTANRMEHCANKTLTAASAIGAVSLWTSVMSLQTARPVWRVAFSVSTTGAVLFVVRHAFRTFAGAAVTIDEAHKVESELLLLEQAKAQLNSVWCDSSSHHTVAHQQRVDDAVVTVQGVKSRFTEQRIMGDACVRYSKNFLW
jgi:hypothetical protein